MLFQQEGAILYSAGKYIESIAAGMKSLQIKPNNAVVLNNICAAYNDLGQWQDAIQACSKALELEPDFSLARNNMKWAKQMLRTEGQP